MRPLPECPGYPQNVAGRDSSDPQPEPSPRRDRRRLPFATVVAAALLVPGAAAPARAELCVVIDPVLAVGCGAPQSAGAERGAAATPTGDEAVTLSSTKTEYDPGRIAVTAKADVSSKRLRAAFAAAGVELDEAIPQIDAYLVRVDPARQADAVQRLRASAAVARAAPDVIVHALDTNPNDSEWPAQTGLRVVGLPRAWDVSRGSPGLIVADVDTGVDPAQPDLRGALVPGVNLVDPAMPPLDDHGHGTAVAGVIAARANNEQGMAGVCWFCSIMPVKVLGSDGSGDDTRIAAGVVWAADHGARVINLSLGGPGDSPQLRAALAYASGKGALVVAAAGNSGTTVPFFPAADLNALSVAATTNDDRAYGWSNYGSWVDVAAPGCNVAPARGRGYGLFCGTSSATPIVSGVAALALANQPSASPEAIRSAIEHAATPLAGFVEFGRVNAPQALARLAAVRRVTDVRRGLLTSARPSRAYDVPAAPGPFSATLKFRKQTVLAVVLQSADGSVLARARGHSPLRLSAPVFGPVRIEIRRVTRARLPFALSLAYGAVAEAKR